jgi:hypothetical protein
LGVRVEGRVIGFGFGFGCSGSGFEFRGMGSRAWVMGYGLGLPQSIYCRVERLLLHTRDDLCSVRYNLELRSDIRDRGNNLPHRLCLIRHRLFCCRTPRTPLALLAPGSSPT